MKRILVIMLLCCNSMFLFGGCGNTKSTQDEVSQGMQIANPWSQWNSIQEAELATGFLFGLPEVIADSYTADEFRTMNNELIEIVYHHDDIEVCVRKQKGEGKDISGDYNQYENSKEIKHNGGIGTVYYNSKNNSEKQIISYQGYSWSIVAPKGFVEDFNQEFFDIILK